MRRRTPLAIAALAVGGLALSACTAGGSAPAGNGEDVELTFFTFETPNLDSEYWEEMIANASAEVPGVTIKRIVGENTLDYVQSLYATGQGPDIILGGPWVEPLATKGELATWTEDEFGDLEVPTGFTGEIDGKLYGPPPTGGDQAIPLVYYNKDAFETAGIDAPPTSWDEFLEVSAQLKDAGFVPIELGGGGEDTWAASMPFSAITAADIMSQDPEWFEKKAAGEVSFTDPEFLASVEKITKLSEAGYFDMEGLSRSYADTEQAFRDQKAVMYPMGNWFSASADATPLDFELGVFGMPNDEGANVVPIPVGGASVVVSKDAADVDLAKKWALAYVTSAKNIEKNAVIDGSLVGAQYDIPEDKMGDAYLATLDVYRAAQEDGNTVPAWMNMPSMTPPGFTAAIDPAMVDLINLRMTPEEFGAYLDQKWDELSVE